MTRQERDEFRRDAAKAAMQGLIAGNYTDYRLGEDNIREIAEVAVKFANELVRQLTK